MEQKDKELLLKDISARLPYGLKCKVKNRIGIFIIKDLYCGGKGVCGYFIEENRSFVYPTIDVKPYLRPLSSMTEDEKKELLSLVSEETHIVIEQIKTNNCGIEEGKYHFNHLLELDWLNAHHFDYRGLIPMGFALEAPADMYNFK